MIKNIVAGGRVYAIDTDTTEITQSRELGWKYVRDRYFVENAGEFIFPKDFNLDPIKVDKGDYILVFKDRNNVFSYAKANMKDAIDIIDNIDTTNEDAKKQCTCCEDCSKMCSDREII